jgi:hypothetical protein
MASASRLECPKCRKQYAVYASDTFQCTHCGTLIDVARETKVYSRNWARQQARNRILKKLRGIGIIILLITIVMVWGFLLSGWTRVAALVFFFPSDDFFTVDSPTNPQVRCSSLASHFYLLWAESFMTR